MIGIILAAGHSKRMGELTKAFPKCMLPIQGRPLLHHTIDRLKEVGCDEIVIIVGYKSENITATDCTLIENINYSSNNVLHSLMFAREYLSEDVICCYSDIWLEPEVLIDLNKIGGDIVISVDDDWKNYYLGRTEHPINEAENVLYDSSLRIHRIGKDIIPINSSELTCGEFRGLWKMNSNGSKKFVNVFDDLDLELDMDTPFQNALEWQKSYITDILQEMTDLHQIINLSITKRKWAELDTQQDYNRLLKIAECQGLVALMS